MARTLDMNYGNVSQMKVQGWTEDDFAALKVASRSRDAAITDGKFVWPLVNGYRLLYTFFNEQERQIYMAWYKAQPCHKGTTGSKHAPAIDTQLYLECVKWIQENHGSLPKCFLKLGASVVDQMPELKYFGKLPKKDEQWPAYQVMFGMNPNIVNRAAALAAMAEDEKLEPKFTMAELEALPPTLKEHILF